MLHGPKAGSFKFKAFLDYIVILCLKSKIYMDSAPFVCFRIKRVFMCVYLNEFRHTTCAQMPVGLNSAGTEIIIRVSRLMLLGMKHGSFSRAVSALSCSTFSLVPRIKHFKIA